MGRYKLTILGLLASTTLFAEEHNIADTLFHHVLNGNELELFPGIPAIHLPFNMSVHQFMLGLAVLLLLVFFGVAKKASYLTPSKITLTLENILLFVRNDIVYPVMGEKEGPSWVPFFTTLFFFLLLLNLLGLIPAFKTATGNINVTMALAILVLIISVFHGFKQIGWKQFFKNLYPEGTAKPLGLFVFLLEFLSLFTKTAVLGLRLFANMFAGHMAILSFLVLIFVISPFFGFIATPFAVFTYVLEVLIAFLQALVFTLLSCIFISMASSH